MLAVTRGMTMTTECSFTFAVCANRPSCMLAICHSIVIHIVCASIKHPPYSSSVQVLNPFFFCRSSCQSIRKMLTPRCLLCDGA